MSIGSRGNVSDIGSDGSGGDGSCSSTPRPLRGVEDIVKRAGGEKAKQLPSFFYEVQARREARARGEVLEPDDSSGTGDVTEDVSESLPPGLFKNRRPPGGNSGSSPMPLGAGRGRSPAPGLMTSLPQRRVLERGGDDERWYMQKGEEWRRALLRAPWRYPTAAMHLAASVVQRAWRGSWLSIAKPSSIQVGPAPGRRASASKPLLGEPQRRVSVGARGRAAAAAAARLRQRYFDLLKRHCTETALAAGGYRSVTVRTYSTFEHFCAALIQGKWRTRKYLSLVRKVAQYKRYKVYHVAAFELQRAWKNHKVRARLQAAGQDTTQLSALAEHARICDAAARKLQRTWRSMNSYRIYESLKDMIAGFRGCGDPCLLLRTVLPRESMLLDPAMQVHVRFRLGGSRFPPSIYYKIFTHGKVCDVGAFAPRNYALQRAYGPAAEGAGWYERHENNGWRPLATRLCPGEERLLDDVERASARKCVKHFHYSRLRRRQDMERRRQQRTVEWMRKLYGLAGAAEGDSPAAQLQSWASGSPAGPGGAARMAGNATPRRLMEPSDAGSPRALEPRPPSGPPPAGRRPRGSRPASDASMSMPGTPPTPGSPGGGSTGAGPGRPLDLAGLGAAAQSASGGSSPSMPATPPTPRSSGAGSALGARGASPAAPGASPGSSPSMPPTPPTPQSSGSGSGRGRGAPEESPRSSPSMPQTPPTPQSSAGAGEGARGPLNLASLSVPMAEAASSPSMPQTPTPQSSGGGSTGNKRQDKPLDLEGLGARRAPPPPQAADGRFGRGAEDVFAAGVRYAEAAQWDEDEDYDDEGFDQEEADRRLLEWSRQVDFEAYMGTWQLAACTDVSEGNLPIRTASLRGKFVARAY